MNTLTTKQINWISSCGFTQTQLVKRNVLAYAESSMSLSEYASFYSKLTPVMRQYADRLIKEIEIQTNYEMSGVKVGA